MKKKEIIGTDDRNLDVSEIVSGLEEKVKELFLSDDYLNFLQKLSLLHDYSFNNVLLIMQQCPEASMVASFQTFNKMHRRVKKGSKAIKVLCPCPVQYKKEVTRIDEDGNKITEEVDGKRTFFKLGNVFDISQTVATDEEGEIKSFTNELHYDSDFLKQLLTRLKKSQTIPILYDDSLRNGSANGYYKVDNKEIYLKKDMSDLQELKTLVHELSHYYQHEHYKDMITGLSRNDLEVSAESSAYVVLQMIKNSFGIKEIDSSEYSVGYVASWSKDKSLKELKTTLSLISKISNDLFKEISTIIPNPS